MNVLQIGSVDLVGRRFNGYDLNAALRQDGIEANQMVVSKFSRDKHVVDLSRGVRNARRLRVLTSQLEAEFSVRGMYFPFGHAIERHSAFKEADVVQYHFIYNDVLSLAQLAELTHKKASLMSIHDCFLMTGHCVHPMSCTGFETGCVQCPDIERFFAMKEDKAAINWAVKKRVFEEAKLELVAGSKWMLDMIKRSPILSHLQTHFIPFGIDVEFYAKERAKARKKLGIPQDAFVLFFRAQNELKGLAHIQSALALMEKKPFLVTCGLTDAFPGYGGGVKEMGTVTNDNTMAELYAACDVFLMPSVGESFGFMAIECMASGKPIIVADGTALPGVTFAPECGISVPQGDAEALKAAIERLRDAPDERKARGELGQRLAREHYRFEIYYKKHRELYEEIAGRGNEK